MVLSYVKRFLRLYAGLFLCAVSILLAIQGGVGVTPWDVFHMGIQNITGISYGTVNILVGLCILTTSIVLGEPIGFGTLCNTLSVGYMVDFLKWLTGSAQCHCRLRHDGTEPVCAGDGFLPLYRSGHGLRTP